MPSGPSHWHEHWGDCHYAWEYLRKRGFTQNRFVIHPPEGLVPDLLDQAAIEYLVLEWDWAYEPRPQED